MARVLPRGFYDRPTLVVARELIGKVLVHRRGRTMTSGVIVEVEAYIGESDPACHAAPGPTRRNRPLYGPPGFAYVYLNYGMHYLVNVVTEAQGQPAAVLIRALEPLDGMAAMRRRRGLADAPADRLCRGPGNVTKAMGISLAHNEADLLGSRLSIEDRGTPPRVHHVEPPHRDQCRHRALLARLCRRKLVGQRQAAGHVATAGIPDAQGTAQRLIVSERLVAALSRPGRLDRG